MKTQGIAAESAFMGETIAEAYAKALRNPEELTDGEILQVSGYRSTRLWSVLQLFEGYKDELVSKQLWEERKLFYIKNNNFPFARAYFTSVSPLFPPNFAGKMDQAYQANKRNEYIHLNALKDALVSELSHK